MVHTLRHLATGLAIVSGALLVLVGFWLIYDSSTRGQSYGQSTVIMGIACGIAIIAFGGLVIFGWLAVSSFIAAMQRTGHIG